MPGGEQLVEPRQQVVAGDDARSRRSPRPAFARIAFASAAHAAGFMPPALVTIFRLGCACSVGVEAAEDVEEVGGVAGRAGRARFCSARIDMVSSARYSSVR